jgi:poly-beta-1,6-N-acetyl-D-glucosamine synthase
MLNLVWFVGQRKLFLKHHLHLRKNFVGFIFYFLFFYLIMVPSCIFGYLSELFKMRKRWGTK